MTPEQHEARFWSKVQKTDSCWFWSSYHLTDGRPYTTRQWTGKRGPELVHRILYRELVGPLAPGIDLHHVCRNKRCVNPEHLVPVAHADHTRLHAAADPKTHCPQGHEYTEKNTGWRYNPRKGRVCKTCARLRKRLYYARKTGRTLDQVKQIKRRYP